ncbi:MAG: hypothetical protein AVDCRST_MAG30-4625, partial [uncultured Solirubrobacteraceae bacterium]
ERGGERAGGRRGLGRPRRGVGVPRAAARAHRGPRRPAPQSVGAQGAAARSLRRLPWPAGGDDAPTADPGGLPRLLPPHRPRPGRRPHARRGARAPAAAGRRVQVAQHARRRADHRDDGDRRAAVGARRRPRPPAARDPPRARPRAARAHRGGVPALRARRPARRRRRGRSRGGALRRLRGGLRGDEGDDADAALLRHGRRRPLDPPRGGALALRGHRARAGAL